MMHAANNGPPTMAASHYVPPPGRQPRPRRKSLEQLEAKYKALMRNMLMYQIVRKRNMCREAGAESGAGVMTEHGLMGGAGGAGSGGQLDDRSHVYQGQPTFPTPPASSSSAASNLEDSGVSNHASQYQPRATHQTQPLPVMRERQQQKRLQGANSGPRPAYDRREADLTRRARPAGRHMSAAMQFAYEELTSIPQQEQQQPHHQQHQMPSSPQQESVPEPIQHATNIYGYPHQQFMHHMPPPHYHAHHEPLATPVPAHLAASYTTGPGHHHHHHHHHQPLPTVPAPYNGFVHNM